MHTKWVPHILTDKQKMERVRCSKLILSALRRSNRDHLIVTGDETWVYFDNPPSTEWVGPGGSPTKRCKIGITNRKLMMTVFFSGAGMELVDYLPEGKTIDSEYFCSVVLTTLKDNISKRRLATGIQGTLLHYDNAPAHSAKSTKHFIDAISWERLPQPPYSPDLAPCDFYLFGALKMYLEGTYARDREEIIKKCNDFLKSIKKSVPKHHGGMETETQCMHYMQW